MSDSDDDDHSDSELDDLMYLMSGTVENDDEDDVQEVNIGEWNMVRNYKTRVEVDGVDQHLLAIAREEVPIVLEHVRVQIVGGIVRHLHNLSPARFLKAWMDTNLPCFVKQYINKNLLCDPVSNSEILAFIQVELMICFAECCLHCILIWMSAQISVSWTGYGLCSIPTNLAWLEHIWYLYKSSNNSMDASHAA